MLKNIFILLTGAFIACACQSPTASISEVQADTTEIIKPTWVSDTVTNDSDDPAIWINASDPSQSLVIGTDKGGDSNEGGLFVFDLQGKEIVGKRIAGLRRPNNVDVAYGLMLGGKPTDIAVCTERNTNTIRVISLPGMQPVDGGGIPVFEGDSLRAPMGIALYTASNGVIYAIVGRKSGHDGSYLWQYALADDGTGKVSGRLVRKFGNYSGRKEIESIAVDNELGYVYCSDEGVGVRKYYAHPDSSGVQLALFATEGFTEDHEGISIYKVDNKTGYILVSDQGANKFHVFAREGSATNAHDHSLMKTIKTSTQQSDGSDVSSFSFPGFEHGLFVAMSDDKTFQFYRWESLAGNTLKMSGKASVPAAH